MMKRWIALLTAMILFVAPVGAMGEEGELRHEVHGDESRIEVEEAAGESHGEGKEEASVGTDVYLWVDPDSASYVTIQVIDDAGNILPNTKVYLIYNGIRELCGITDEKGQCSLYLFRNVEYGYEAEHADYRTGKGSFTAQEETRLVTIVLEKYYRLTVYVKDGDVMQPDVTVYVDNLQFTTNRHGYTSLPRVRGQYNITVIAPDGRVFRSTAVVQGDTDVLIDISQDDGKREGGFLVYDKYYNPEDYVLTRYDHKAEDLQRAEGETEEAYAERIVRYLEENPAVVVVEAQPEREQLAEGGDRDRTDEEGKLLYGHRSMIPYGYLLRSWEEQGFTQVVFRNEEMGIALELEELHSPQMTKLLALLDALKDPQHGAAQVVREEVRLDENGLWKAGLWKAGLTGLYPLRMDVTKMDLNAIRSFEFAFDHDAEAEEVIDREEHEVLENRVYEEARFEMMITPVLKEALVEMILHEASEKPEKQEEIWLTDTDYYRTHTALKQMEGRLSEEESEELYRYLTDGKLTAEELSFLQERAAAEEMTEEEVEQLLSSGITGKMYRVSCWVQVNDRKVNITSLLESMQVMRNADAAYAEAFEEAAEELAEAKDGMTAEEVAEKYAVELDEHARAQLEEEMRMMWWDGQQKANTAENAVRVWSGLPQADTEFYELVSEKVYRTVTVNVRKETFETDGKQLYWYSADAVSGQTERRQGYVLNADVTVSGLAWLYEKE